MRTLLLFGLLAGLAVLVFALAGLDPGYVAQEDDGGDALESTGAPPTDDPGDVVLVDDGGRARASAGDTTLTVEALLPDGTVSLATRAWAVGPEDVVLPRKLAPAEWKGVTPGEWTVFIEAVNFLPGEKAVSVVAGERNTAQLELRSGSRVKGRVLTRTGKPVNGLVVWFLREGMAEPKKDDTGVKPQSATSGVDGSFRSKLLEPGTIRVYLDPLGRQQRVIDSSILLIAGEDREAEVVVPGGGSVVVRVVNPPPGTDKVRIGLLEMRRTGRGTNNAVAWMSAGIQTIGDDGSATFENVKPGSEYRVEARHGKGHFTSEQNFTFRANQGFDVAVTLPGGGGDAKAPLGVQVNHSLAAVAGREPGVYWN